MVASETINMHVSICAYLPEEWATWMQALIKCSPIPSPGGGARFSRDTKYLRWTKGASFGNICLLMRKFWLFESSKSVCVGCFATKSLITCFWGTFCQKHLSGEAPPEFVTSYMDARTRDPQLSCDKCAKMHRGKTTLPSPMVNHTSWNWRSWLWSFIQR